MSSRALAVVALTTALSPAARALPVHFDCFFPDVRGDCRELETALISTMAVLERGDREGATIVIAVRGVAVDAGVRYDVSVQGRVNGSDVAVAVSDRVPDALPDDAALVRQLNLLQRAVSPALALETSARTEGGAVTLRLRDPLAAPLAQARPDAASSTGWYVRPNVSLDWSVATTEQLFVFGGGRVNYSDETWRLVSDVFAGYRRVDDKDLGSPPFEARFLGHESQLVHSLGAGFSVRATLLQAHDSNDNQLFTSRPFVGLEWIRMPFLASDTSNFGVRYQLGGEHVLLLEENLNGRLQESFLLHDASAFVSWHFDRVDVELEGAFRSILDDIAFSRLSAEGSVVWRITDELNVALTGSAAYRNKLINAPAELSDDPLEQIFGGNFGALATNVSVSVAYTFGNALLDRQDRRWR